MKNVLVVWPCVVKQSAAKHSARIIFMTQLLLPTLNRSSRKPRVTPPATTFMRAARPKVTGIISAYQKSYLTWYLADWRVAD